MPFELECFQPPILFLHKIDFFLLQGSPEPDSKNIYIFPERIPKILKIGS